MYYTFCSSLKVLKFSISLEVFSLVKLSLSSKIPDLQTLTLSSFIVAASTRRSSSWIPFNSRSSSSCHPDTTRIGKIVLYFCTRIYIFSIIYRNKYMEAIFDAGFPPFTFCVLGIATTMLS